MKTPPLLIGAALIFWGWQTGFLIAGAVMAVVLESSRWVKARWPFTDAEFNQLWTFTTLLFIAAGAITFATNDGARTVTGFFDARSYGERSKLLNEGAKAVLVFVQWLPMIFFPFMAAHAFSGRDKIDYSNFSWLIRRRLKAQTGGTTALSGKGVNVSHPFFAICVISSGAVITEANPFYLGLFVLVAWALWPLRSPRFAAPVWAALILLVGVAGFFGIRGLHRLRDLADGWHSDWLSSLVKSRGFDSKESHTGIGKIGRRKGSGQIVMRIETEGGQRAPTLLREVSYTTYKGGTWASVARSFIPVFSETNETSWRLLENAASARQSVTIANYLRGGEGLLALPLGTARLDDLQVFRFETNRLGVVRVGEGPGLALFKAHYGRATWDGLPDKDDELVSPQEAPVIQRIAEELHLSTLPRAARIKAIERYFSSQFSYQLWQEEGAAGSPRETALAHFLNQSKAGHCEYFATATVMLLRQAGIPARYTVGWSVQEADAPGRFVIRERHAHAWSLYYDEATQMWRELDTTPGTWVEAEAERKPFWEPLSDAWSRMMFEFSKLRWGRSTFRQYIVWALVVVLVAVAARFIVKKRWKQSAAAAKGLSTRDPFPGLDSEFYRIESRLLAFGLERRSGETLRDWIRRVEENLPASPESLYALLRLHNRLRFDPRGLSEQERGELRAGVEAWLGGMRQPSRKPSRSSLL